MFKASGIYILYANSFLKQQTFQATDTIYHLMLSRVPRHEQDSNRQICKNTGLYELYRRASHSSQHSLKRHFTPGFSVVLDFSV
jgi:hypothetical protein